MVAAMAQDRERPDGECVGAVSPDAPSRRDFLVTTGTAAGAALLVPAAASAATAAATGASAPPPQELGPGLIPVQLLLNGKVIQARIEPRDTLVQVLREQLGLTGTKIGCDRGACGACTVWVDGQPTPSCMTLALDVAGIGAKRPPRALTTIEGLAPAQKLHPVQQSFVDHDALQCGFCTPGMVMSCAALYEQRRAAGKLATIDEQAVREAVAGNLCRCGSYPHVIAATVAAARGQTPPRAGGAR